MTPILQGSDESIEKAKTEVIESLQALPTNVLFLLLAAGMRRSVRIIDKELSKGGSEK